MALMDKLQQHMIESAAKRCAEACAARGRSVMVIVLAADTHGEIANGAMISAWDQLSPGIAQGFGQMLHRAGYTLEEASVKRDAAVLKGGVGGLG